MRKSEIFESFIKIAQEKGLVSKAETEAKDIAKLYDTKPEQSEGMTYKKNIVENAHPDSVVVSPAYDKLNGLVENLNERQNIILNIVNKPNDGQLTNHKWAEKELLMSLVRLANDLDNKNKEELRLLADACLFQVSNKMTKTAAFPLAAVAIAVPLVLGALYVQQHMSFANEGFRKNVAKLNEEIDDLLDSGTGWGVVGTQYKPEFINEMKNFKAQLADLSNTVSQSESVINQLEKPRMAKELVEVAKKPETQAVTEAYKALRTKIANLTPYISKVLNNFASEDYKARQIEDKGALTSLVDKTQILHGGKGLVADDFDDVRRAITPFRQSLVDIVKVLRGANSVEQKAKQELELASSEFSNQFDGGTAPQAAPGSPEDAVKQQVSKLDDEVGSLLPKT